MKAPIRVLIADDSDSLRRMMTTLLREQPGIELVGEARDGPEAVALAEQLRPTVITMDVDMPGMSGLEATSRIMARAPARILVVCALGQERQVDLSFRAIEAGALELIAKPRGSLQDVQRWGRRLAEAIRLMAEVPVVTRRGEAAPSHPRATTGQYVQALGLVASTGGPPALAEVLGAMPADLPVPLLIAQHISPGFSEGLARWLRDVTTLRVEQVRSAARAVAGTVYLPPDGHDLEIDPGARLRVSPSMEGICPSGDRLLTSLARVFGAGAGGIVMTGMGDDGARGLLEIRRAGGWTAAQDEASSIVYGMPQRAVALGAAAEVLPLGAFAPTILEVTGSRRHGARPAS